MLHVLVHPRDSMYPAPTSPTVDIIAVHGLNGHYMNTWTDKPGNTIWLKDLLPEKLPGCRVMTFQYNASFTSMSAGRVRDAANTLLQLLRDERDDPIYLHVPIVFVGHSLGGIVIKQAISQAHDDSGYDIKKIAKCIKGIVFFGTPHRGSDIANWAALAKRIGGPVIPGPNRGFFHLLQTNSEELYKITEDFRPLSANYAIVSFYEEYPYPTLGKVIVERILRSWDCPMNEDL
ncbi:Alpha/Beta hydrolase protein [Hypoxylon argillaceum]|nr:Alpha/Beta hydrolase protein [Hypoxylon argillaceum]